MGNMHTQEVAEAVEEGGMTLDMALGWHLGSNHYPPVPQSMVEPCKAAIEAANEGDLERMIELPSPVTYQGGTSAPTWAIVEQHHLDSFINAEADS